MGEPPNFDRFLEALKGTNPFRGTRVTDPASSDGDVPEVHAGVFEKLTRRVNSVRTEKMPVGVLLQGAAGVGKSHLIARLFQWAHEDHATVVYLHNILASPDRMLRYLLYATVSDLAGHPAAYPESRLYSLLTRAVLKGTAADGRKLNKKGYEQRRQAMLDVGKQVDPAGTVYPILACFFDAVQGISSGGADADARARAAVNWLSGEMLDAPEAALLDKSARPEEEVGLADDAEAEHVLHVLARVCARADRPLVLCLDQVDNLDEARVTALTAVVQALLDRGQHLLVLISGVKESLLRLRRDGVIGQAVWDRIADRSVELMKISPEQARSIVSRRLDQMMNVFRETPEVAKARKSDPLFPVGTDWLTARLGELPEVRPRDVVTWARDRWEEQQELAGAKGGKAWLESWTAAVSRPEPEASIESLIDEQVKKKIAEGITRRRLQPTTLPPDADNLATLTVELLGRCKGDNRYTLRDISRSKPKGGKKAAPYHVLATEQRGDGLKVSDGLTFVTADNANGFTAALSRMLDDEHAPDHRILVTDEERRPLRMGAKGKDVYDKLCKLGRSEFIHLKLTFAHYAELDSMMGVLGAARVGDLEVEHPRGKPYVVSEAEVLGALHRLGQFLAHPLLRELLTEDLGGGQPAKPVAPGFDERRAKEHVMGELSWRIGLMARELAKTFASRERLEGGLDHVWARLKDVARKLHEEGKVYATAQDDDLFVHLRKKPS